MSQTILAYNSLLNPDLVTHKKIEKQTWYGNKLSGLMSFTKPMGNSKTRYEFTTNGQESVRKNTMSAINIHEEELSDGGDRAMVPVQLRLGENPAYGDEETTGKAISMSYGLKEVYRANMRQRVNVYTGRHSFNTNEELFNAADSAKVQLGGKFEEFIEHHGFYSTMCRGFSNNVLQHFGFAQVSHPNLYYIATSTQVLTQVAGTPGSATYETNTAAAVDQYADAATEALNHTALLNLRVALQTHRIDPIVTMGGQKLWVVVAHPKVVNQIRRLSVFTDSLQQARAREPMNPIFTNASCMFEGLLFYEDIQAWGVDKLAPGSAYNASTNPLVYGVSSPTTALDTRALKMTFVLGAGAVTGVRRKGFNAIPEMTDGDNKLDLIGSMDFGMARGEVWNDSAGAGKHGKGAFNYNSSSLALILNSNV